MVLVVLKILVGLVFVYYGVSFGWVVVRYFGIWGYVVVFRIAAYLIVAWLLSVCCRWTGLLFVLL